MSILKSTNSGKYGYIKFCLEGDKYDHSTGGINYYYKKHPYGMQPPFYISDMSYHPGLRNTNLGTGFIANVYDSMGQEKAIRIVSVKELHFVEMFWNELIKNHERIDTLTRHPICTLQLEFMAKKLEEIGERNKITVEMKHTRRRFAR